LELAFPFYYYHPLMSAGHRTLAGRAARGHRPSPRHSRRSSRRRAISGPYSIVVSDFNGAGKLDLAVGNYKKVTLSILLGNGDGMFAARQSFAAGKGPVSLAVGDLNRDGILDIVTADSADNTVSVLLSTRNK
jgi:hypothetical protein